MDCNLLYRKSKVCLLIGESMTFEKDICMSGINYYSCGRYYNHTIYFNGKLSHRSNEFRIGYETGEYFCGYNFFDGTGIDFGRH